MRGDQHGLAVHRAHGTACQDGIFHQARYHASSPQGRTTMVRTVRGKAFLCNEPSSTHWQCERCPSGTGQLACGRNEGVHQAERSSRVSRSETLRSIRKEQQGRQSVTWRKPFSLTIVSNQSKLCLCLNLATIGLHQEAGRSVVTQQRPHQPTKRTERWTA